MNRCTLLAVTLLTALALGACGGAPAGTGTGATSTTGGTTATDTTGVITGTEPLTETVTTDTTATTGGTTGTATTDTTATTGGTTGTATTDTTTITGTSVVTGTRVVTGTGSTGGTTAPSSDTIAGVLSSQNNISTLRGLVEAAGLETVLNEAGPYTLFAPTDEAFAALPADTLQRLLTNPEQIREILTYHVTTGQLSEADLSSSSQLTTLQGSSLSVTASGTEITLNSDTTVTGSVIQTSNGTIYLIDKVLLPPGVTL